jgi:hypothetical protein
MIVLKKYIPLTLCAVIALLVASCDESDAVIKGKLDVILADDLVAILDSVSPSALIDKPYYELVSYKEYDEGAYSRMAVADFYFLKPLAGVVKKIRRKYRYHRRMGMWDRYHNKYYTVVPGEEGGDGGGK